MSAYYVPQNVLNRCINSIKFYNNELLSLVYTQGNWYTEGWNDMSNVTQLVNGRSEVQPVQPLTHHFSSQCWFLLGSSWHYQPSYQKSYTPGSELRCQSWWLWDAHGSSELAGTLKNADRKEGTVPESKQSKELYRGWSSQCDLQQPRGLAN